MEIIDKTAWARRDIYELFSKTDYPFYSVTIPIDVTNVKAASKKLGLSFYFLMIWLCTKAVNSVPEFRMRIRGEELVLLDQTDPSFTHMPKDAEAFRIITMPWEEDCAAFCAHARERAAGQTDFIDAAGQTDALIYISCTPWFDFTALTNEHNFDKDDTIPRLAWGRYYEENGRVWVHMSVEVNHRTIDGFHIGKLKAAIDREICGLL